MVKIASDLGATTQAASHVAKIQADSGQSVSLGQSNISGMERGAKVANQLLPTLQRLSESIKKHADKFPQLARVIESRDATTRFGGM
ncbi:hypothetical protein [Streptococcus cuniculi]|uniref:TIGR04197 family type VII secretion effector n=1 Tax=Streptococcus cuniculi TaxID=1432788 RepID=A0A4Y9JC34_9STRE|nr:hypothetical protein [Streptococcus cuniculi]MBF0777457.1 hypothetical protein [Streptococcus cuniculi]TFU98512.1 hypothetical protein E4T82_01725 [Streptococcus cuniculi]